jgi:hypothetical protein
MSLIKDSNQHPQFRDIDLSGTLVMALVDALKSPKPHGNNPNALYRQADEQMVRHLMVLAKPAINEHKENLNFVNNEMKNCNFELSLEAGRIYVSLFEQASRD